MRFKEKSALFIHVPKTGGTTITMGIAKKLYPKYFRNGESSAISLYNDSEKRVIKRNVRKAHGFASEYKEELGSEEYYNHYTFGFVRNPFAQIASLYVQLTYMNIQQNPTFKPYKSMTFERFIMGDGEHSMVGNDLLIDQVKFFCDPSNGDVIVNDIYPFDYYNKSVDIISKKIDVDIDTNVVLRETKKNPVYTPKMVNQVLENYQHVYDFYKEVKENFEVNVLQKKQSNISTHT